MSPFMHQHLQWAYHRGENVSPSFIFASMCFDLLRFAGMAAQAEEDDEEAQLRQLQAELAM